MLLILNQRFLVRRILALPLTAAQFHDCLWRWGINFVLAEDIFRLLGFVTRGRFVGAGFLLVS